MTTLSPGPAGAPPPPPAPPDSVSPSPGEMSPSPDEQDERNERNGQDERNGQQAQRAWGAPAFAVLVLLLLPLALYYALRAQGFEQWLALLVSGAAPALHALATAVIRRRVDALDAFALTMIAVGVTVCFLSGDPRVLLIKDAATAAAAGTWMLLTLAGARPFAFRVSQLWCARAVADGRDAAWPEAADFRRGLRLATALWAGGQLLDAVTGVVYALTLPVDVVPLINRAQGLVLLGAVTAASIALSRRYRRRYGVSVFGAVLPRPQQKEMVPS